MQFPVIFFCVLVTHDLGAHRVPCPDAHLFVARRNSELIGALRHIVDALRNHRRVPPCGQFRYVNAFIAEEYAFGASVSGFKYFPVLVVEESFADFTPIPSSVCLDGSQPCGRSPWV